MHDCLRMLPQVLQVKFSIPIPVSSPQHLLQLLVLNQLWQLEENGSQLLQFCPDIFVLSCALVDV